MSNQESLLKKLWVDKGFDPNPKQEEAILYNGKAPLFITAAPGSGKTRVLLWRTVNLIICHNVKPDEIYLGTFTEKAAYQLREGLKSLLGLASNMTNQPYDISKMYLGTIHSNCHRILIDRNFSKEKHRMRPPIVLDESRQYFHVYRKRFWNEMIRSSGFTDTDSANTEINEFFERPGLSRHNAVTNCIAFFNRLSEEVIDPTDYKVKDSTFRKLLKMYEYYLNSLRGQAVKRTDLSLLQQEALETIKDNPGSNKVFKHIIIDEYQDTNAVQEKLFFSLAKGGANLCVVGDDDQALYRFRGATVENFVDFENRCARYLKETPKKVNLNINYRSREEIVNFYTDFIKQIDWAKDKKKNEYYRVADKKLEAHRKTKDPAVLATEPNDSVAVCESLVDFVVKLKKEGKIQDYNQVAFLFPYLKNNPRIKELKAEFERHNIKVYAPRAGRFLDVDESVAIFGLFIKVLGMPSFSQDVTGRDASQFIGWLEACNTVASDIISKDSALKRFIDDKITEITQIKKDYELLIKCAERHKIDLKDNFKRDMRRIFVDIPGLSEKARRSISSKFFERMIENREREGRPLIVRYAINRATALDWNLLDLFYQLNGFKHFRTMYDLAEKGEDEGPVCNLGLITQYLADYMDNYGQVIVAETLSTGILINTFFISFCFSLYRLQESEFEDADDPFPKGRVSFLTIHQSKGLEFPVVVLGSLGRRKKDASVIEVAVRELLKKGGEPLDKIYLFDKMRLFYVALSRAANLLIIPRIKQRGIQIIDELKPLLERDFCTLDKFNFKKLPVAELKEEDLGKSYSYTGDYLMYKKCPRNYMIFRKYGFVPSRSQTMFFGSLVHRTIEDLHNYLISLREKAGQ
jgi:DNA helicase-2/ATP-dependent DNA helicase PcrA